MTTPRARWLEGLGAEQLRIGADLPLVELPASYAEQTARHNGHLDILREPTDRVTGD